MDATIIVAIVTTSGTVVVALITLFQNKILKKQNKSLNDKTQKLETEIREIKLISSGMVVGYFFSFIKPLYEEIAKSQLKIVDNENREYKISKESTKLELIIPKQLDKTSFNEADIFFKSVSGVGAIVNSEGNVLYKKINYRIVKEMNEVVVLIDVPAILKSALKYYKAPLFQTTENISDLLQREMSNFKEEIKRMINNDDLDNWIAVREY